VWLHEASLVGAYVGLAHASGSRDWAVDHVWAHLDERERELVDRAGVDPLDAPALHTLGVTMLGEVLDRARSVIVNSSRAAAMVRRERPDGPPVLVLPHAHHPAREPDHVPDRGDVVAVGWLAGNKSPDVAVDVLRRLIDVHDGARLTFVGAADGDTADHVRALARRAGVADRVQFTGRLADDEYVTRIGAARVGLQLREGDLGEMSGAVADLAAAGIPTVTTLQTEGPSRPGVRVVELDAERIASEIAPLLTDDAGWRAASADAIDRARSWTFDDVARALAAWLADVDRLPPATVHQ
jgi:glycosyltransferase involved in cell wall biosynthesis